VFQLLRDATIEGLAAVAEGRSAVVTITAVTQDEPVYGHGAGDTGPDAVISGDGVLLRAERSGEGNGRVYRIAFSASNGRTCAGSVLVGVPRDRAGAAVDDGQSHSSTAP
jgi:hypothetical protein